MAYGNGYRNRFQSRSRTYAAKQPSGTYKKTYYRRPLQDVTRKYTGAGSRSGFTGTKRLSTFRRRKGYTARSNTVSMGSRSNAVRSKGVKPSAVEVGVGDGRGNPVTECFKVGDLFMRLTPLADAGPVVGKTPGCGNKIFYHGVTEYSSIELTSSESLFHRRVFFSGKFSSTTSPFVKGAAGWQRTRSFGYGSKMFRKWTELFFPEGTLGSSVYDTPLRRDTLTVLEDSKKVHSGRDVGNQSKEKWRNDLSHTVSFDADPNGALEIGYGFDSGGVVDFTECSRTHFLLDIWRVGVPGSANFPVQDSGSGGYTFAKNPDMVDMVNANVRVSSRLVLYWRTPYARAGGASSVFVDIQAPEPSKSVDAPAKTETLPTRSKVKREYESDDEDMDMDGIPDAEDEIRSRRSGSEVVVLPTNKKGTRLKG